MKIKFWGVRGSVPCPLRSHLEYGGNTSCVELQIRDHILIFDAGSGLRPCGKSLQQRGLSSATLLLSHTHLDHINGFPFFPPLCDPNFSLAVFASHLKPYALDLPTVLSSQMRPPFFPITLKQSKAHLSFQEYAPKDLFFIHESIKIQTAPLNHPGYATGYRVDHNNHSFAYVTDTEHTPGHDDLNVLFLIDKVDLMIYDATYTQEEYLSHQGWGHSTWQEAVRLAQIAQVKHLALFHHEPDHDDIAMKVIETQAQSAREHTIAAREGMTFSFE